MDDAAGGESAALSIQPAQVEEVLDHFKCYVPFRAAAEGGIPFVNQPALLTDQFGPTEPVIREARLFCNPASKTVPGSDPTRIRFPSAHLFCYRLDAPDQPPEPRIVETQDQFGSATLTVTTPHDLCVPSNKLFGENLPDALAPPGPLAPPAEELLDHFKCYLVAGGTIQPPSGIVLQDQFDRPEPTASLLASSEVLVGPYKLCNPVEKTIFGRTSPVLRPEAHLTCYQIVEERFDRIFFDVENQFGLYNSVFVFQAAELCVPATKREQPPPPTEHFKCYLSGSRIEPRDVTLSDQFGTAQDTVFAVFSFCNPVTKRLDEPGPVPSEFAHLTCYVLASGGPGLASSEAQLLNRVVETQDQFGTAILRVDLPHSLCLPSVKQAVDGVPEPPHTVQEVEAAVEHYKCYFVEPVTPIAPPAVFDTDQFTSTRDQLVPGPLFLCNPASKNGSVVRDPEKHLTCYNMPSEPVERTVDVEDQFGPQTLGVQVGFTLCTPATKREVPPPPTEHFKCYVHGPAIEPRDVTLTDQFGTEPATVFHLVEFCNPVIKLPIDAEPVNAPAEFAHMACYAIRSRPPLNRRVETNDQFGTATLRIVGARTLCVPTVKVAVNGVPEPLHTVAEVEAALDHYKCYDVVPETANVPPPIFSTDQFDATPDELFPGPLNLCTPVAKDGGPVRNPDKHLTCYGLSNRGSAFIDAENQFGRIETFVFAATGLCAPATKRELPAPLSHFKCYDTKAESGKRDVELSDQFGAGPATVKQPRLLCNPVEKRIGDEVTPISDAQAHLQCYDLTEKAEDARRVRVENQFGTHELTTDKAELLCLPSAKSLTGDPGATPASVDHFKCYRVKGEEHFQRSGVTLSDQFHTEETVVAKPEHLCNPVEKRHGSVTTPIRFPELHLVCYGLKSKAFKGPIVNVRDQFGLERVDVQKPQTLCVPSSKTVLDAGG